MVKAIHCHKNCTTPIHRIIIHIGRFQLNRVRGHSAGWYNRNEYIESRIRVVTAFPIAHICIILWESELIHTTVNLPLKHIAHAPYTYASTLRFGRVSLHYNCYDHFCTFRTVTIELFAFAVSYWGNGFDCNLFACNHLFCSYARSFVCSFIRSVVRLDTRATG